MESTLGVAIAALVLLTSTSCSRDPEIADDPIAPDNVFATFERCEAGGASPSASVEVRNGTGHAAAYEVTVRFVADDGSTTDGVARSEVVEPGGIATVRVDADDGAPRVDECDLVSVDPIEP